MKASDCPSGGHGQFVSRCRVQETSCIQEICGDAAYYVDPNDFESIAEGMHRVATDEALRALLIQRGLQRARMFSWRTSAEHHVELFERLLTE